MSATLTVVTINSTQTRKVPTLANEYVQNSVYEVLNKASIDTMNGEWFQLAAGTVGVRRQKFALEDAIEFHVFAPIEVLPCV